MARTPSTPVPRPGKPKILVQKVVPVRGAGRVAAAANAAAQVRQGQAAYTRQSNIAYGRGGGATDGPGPAVGPSPPRDPYLAPPSAGERYLTNYINSFDQRGRATQDYAANTVLPWAQGAIGGVAASSGQTLASLGGVMQSLGNTGVVTPPSFQGSQGGTVTPGVAPGVAAGAQGAQQAAGLSGAYRGSMAAGQVGAGAESTLAALGSKVASLPNVFAQQKNDFMAKVSPILAQLEQSRVDRADRLKQNAFNNELNVQKTILSGAGAGGSTSPKGLAGPSSGPAPAGYTWVQRADGGYDLKPMKNPDGSSPSASGGGGGSPKGQYAPNELAKQGYVGGWEVRPTSVKTALVQATDGSWYTKPKGDKVGPGSVHYDSKVTNWAQNVHKILYGHPVVLDPNDPTKIRTPATHGQATLAVLRQMLSEGLTPDDAAHLIAGAKPPKGTQDRSRLPQGPAGAQAIYGAIAPILGAGRARKVAAHLANDFGFLTADTRPKRSTAPAFTVPGPKYTGPGATS